MEKKNLIRLSVVLAVCVVGCSDDSTSGISKNTGNLGVGEACVSSDQCAESLVCIDDVCSELSDLGGYCDQSEECADDAICANHTCKREIAQGGVCSPNSRTTQCAAGLACIDHICAQARDLGQSCDSKQNVCSDGLTCVHNVCVRYLMEGDACGADENHICNDKNHMQCINGTCRIVSDGRPSCTSSDDCAGFPEMPRCDNSGYCDRYLEAGELCKTDGDCLDNHVCQSVCLTVVGENEPCTLDDNAACAEGLECRSGKCHVVENNLPAGSTCNNSWLFCQDDYVCSNAECRKYVKETEACDESQAIYCEENKSLRCLKNICTPIGNDCQKSSDCVEKDSYCCLDDSCGAVNKCVPYDDETTNDAMCLYKTKPGIFEARIQCRWQPPSSAKPGSKNVEMPPLVGPFGNKAGLKTVVAFWSYMPTVIRFINPETCETLESIEISLSERWYNYPAAADFDGDGLMEFVTGNSTKTYLYKWDPAANGGVGGHVLKAQANVDYRPMSLLYDIDHDGNTEIVGAFGSVIRVNKNDLSMDVLTSKDLFVDNRFTNKVNDLVDGYFKETGEDAAIGNIDGDEEGIAELITAEGLYTWNKTNNSWTKLLTFPWHNTNASGWVRQFAAYADFGTYHPEDQSFDFHSLDGKPEIVISGKDKINLYAVHKDEASKWSSKNIMSVGGFFRGGPITIGDFNNDGLPEIGIASNALFGVYDPKCEKYEAGKCADKNVLWERWSQDGSSGTTASSLFDFDGDGQAEAVYADECFTRVYDGKTGKVLFSAKRSSVTSIEGPVIADVDNDGSAEILMGSDTEQSCYDDNKEKYTSGNAKSKNAVDPIHEGIACTEDADCPNQIHCRIEEGQTNGLCTCTTDNDCNEAQENPAPNTPATIKMYVCAPPIHPSVGFMTNPSNGSARKLVKDLGARPDGWKTGDYQVCRATRKTNDIGYQELAIYKDRLDRWVSSRNIWNQHAYNIINIEDDGKVPTKAQWWANWILKKVDEYLKIDGKDTTEPRPMYNNYRLNKQGQFGAGAVPDITGRFITGSICGKTDDGRYVISGKLCNRGTKPVSTKLPATFYYYSEEALAHKGEKICTSYTNKPIGVGECDQVGCEVEKEAFDKLVGHEVLMITNEDGNGLKSTEECNYTNNNDRIKIDACSQDIVIVN